MKLLKLLEEHPTRSAWSKGVKTYAIDLLSDLNERGQSEDSRLNQYDHIELVVSELTLLNGASNWSEYSYGGSALIYDADIAKTLCTPSELKSRKGGDWQPSKNETWLDVQARALYQACRLLLKLNKKIK